MQAAYEIKLLPVIRMNLEPIIQSEVSQKEKQIPYIGAYI